MQTASESESHAVFRPEIQGLRALAVLLVLGYHVFPGRIGGGYVGVDVFFVISGYLITLQLSREAFSRRTISLTRFWARRARRLLPAALLVLACCLVVTMTLVPSTQREQALRQIGASALYWQNWALASDSVDYLARGNVPTLVQHYWSLSVEEQFYLLWPLLVLGVLTLGRQRGDRDVWRLLFGALALLGTISLICSVVLTRQSPDSAYFVTQTRVWEFSVGALLALVSRRRLPVGSLAAVLGWVGLVAMVGAAVTFTAQTPFPGVAAALPVLGAAAILAAGSSTSAWSSAWWLGTRPAQFVGDLSYSIYLWHWPLIVTLPLVTGEPLRTVDKPVVLIITLLLSWASTRLVEDPVRHSRALSLVPWRTLVVSGVLLALLVGALTAIRVDLAHRGAVAQQRTASLLADPSTRGCTGPPALDPANRCTSPQGSGPLLSPPGIVARQNSRVPYADCQANSDEVELVTCDLGDSKSPRRTVAIVGDSHATMWLAALDRIGRREHWRVVTYGRSSCPFSAARRTLDKYEQTAALGKMCLRKNAQVLDRLMTDPRITTVFVANYGSAYGWASTPAAPPPDPASEGFHAVWKPLVRAGKQVVVLRDIPAVKNDVSLENSTDCLAENPHDWLACANTLSKGLVPDTQAEAAERGAPEGVSVIDLSSQFCDRRWCYAVVGDVIVARDYSHLTREYSILLSPYLLRAFESIDRGAD